MYYLTALNLLILLIAILTLRGISRVKAKQRRLDRRLNHLETLPTISSLKNEYRQVTAFASLNSLLKPRLPLPPLRSYAISPDLALVLVNLIETRRPSIIVEFGGGASTLVCAYRLRELGRGRIYSIDHEEKFAGITQRQLEGHGVADLVDVLHAPLRNCRFEDLAGHCLDWYDEQRIDQLPDNIDMVIVDGPPSRLNPWIRYPALPAIHAKLSPKCAVMLDDADREGETSIVERWLEEFPEFSIIREATEKGTAILLRDL